MKVFIIGPEGSGKSILLTMINRALSQSKDQGTSAACKDIATQKYFTNIFSNYLSKGQWPPSTLEGKLIELRMKWTIGGKSANVACVDPPGQDVRRALSGGQDPLGICASIYNADCLIVVVDLHDHARANSDKKAENTFIIEQALDRATYTGSHVKHVIVALTKCDLFKSEFPQSHWNRRQESLVFLSKKMPEFSIKGYLRLLTSDACDILCVSAVGTTKSIVDDDGIQRRAPTTPPNPIGISDLVASLSVAVKKSNHHHRTNLHQMQWARWRKIRVIICVSVVGTAFVFGALGLKTFTGICVNCHGLGHMNNGWIWKDTCPVCLGSKIISEERLSFFMSDGLKAAFLALCLCLLIVGIAYVTSKMITSSKERE